MNRFYSFFLVLIFLGSASLFASSLIFNEEGHLIFPANTKVGTYRILGTLAKGAYSKVYKIKFDSNVSIDGQQAKEYAMKVSRHAPEYTFACTNFGNFTLFIIFFLSKLCSFEDH